MKKYFILAASLAFLASCTSDEIVDNGGKQEREVPISFQFSQKNMTRADKTLQETGHYNFGVWAYKNTDATNAVMDNYLVGYMDATNKKGYSMSATDQTTLGDAASTADGKSMWAYEKMGSSQYSLDANNTGEEYYLSTDTKYMSNNANQWLKYWDYSSANTEFFAYAPYINGNLKLTFSNTDKKMTFSDNVIEAGFDDLSLYEYMYAYTNHAKSFYNTDVPLQFNRMNSKINIKFYEDVDGYDVEIVDLKGNTSKTVTGVQATPSVRTGTGTTADPYSYTKSTTFWLKGKADVQFPNGTVTTTSCVVTGTSQDGNNLEFRIPEFPTTATNKNIGTTSATATASPSTYYGLPLGTSNVTGFNFHVSYKLIAQDTKETIIVNNATVYVPAANVQWKPNTSYTYIFKITKNSSGTTDKDAPTDDDYVSPTPDPVKSLYPIVFDGCTVVDWIENTATEHPIN